MLSAKSLFEEILDNDESFRLFCSIAASGESQGGWENGRIAALVPASERALAPKIARHGADEDKHGRIFNALLQASAACNRSRSRTTPTTRCSWRSTASASPTSSSRPTSRSRSRTSSPTSRTAGSPNSAPPSRCDLLRKHFADHPDIGRAVKMISNDEDNHLAYCHEELLRFADAGHGRDIQRILRECALAEIRVYRDVSLAVMDHMGRILGWPRPRRRCSPRASTACTRTNGRRLAADGVPEDAGAARRARRARHVGARVRLTVGPPRASRGS